MVHLKVSRPDDMSEVLDCSRKECALLDLQGNASCGEARQNFVDVLDVLLEGVREDNDVVQIDEVGVPLELREDHFQRSLKGRRSVCRSKWHSLALVSARVAREGRLMTIAFVDGQLPVP